MKGWLHSNHSREKSKFSQKLFQSSNQEILSSQVKEKENPNELNP